MIRQATSALWITTSLALAPAAFAADPADPIPPPEGTSPLGTRTIEFTPKPESEKTTRPTQEKNILPTATPSEAPIIAPTEEDYPSKQANPRTENARSTFLGILSGFMPIFKTAPTGNFRVSGCTQWNPKELIGYFLLGQPLKREFKFRENCDIEGPMTVTAAPFDLDLKVRRLGKVDQTVLTLKIDKKLLAGGSRAEVKVTCLKGTLLAAAKPLAKFTADYVIIYNFIESRLAPSPGGHLDIQEVEGKKVAIHEDIHIEQHD